MAKLPLIEQQTSVGQVRASGQDFGAGVGQAVAQAGDALQDIGVAMKRREDVIERVNLMNDFDRWAQESLTALNDSEDIARADTVAKYEQGLRQKADEIIRTHRGTGASRAELEAQVRNQVGQYAKSAIGAQVKAQQQKIGSMIEQKSNELAISAAFAPDQMNNVFAQLDNDIKQFEGAMSPALMAQYKEAGRSKIATGAIAQVRQRGDWQSAEKMLKDPEVGKYLDPNSARKFTIDVAVDKGKAAAEIARQDRNVSAWTQRLGRNLTAEEQMKIRALPEKKDMTVSDQITEYELVTGRPAPQSVIDQFYKVDGPTGAGGMFGNSLQGRALSFVTENAVAYSNGMLSPDQARTYEASLAEAYKPTMRQNPVTGQFEELRPTVPNFVQQAAQQGSRFYGGGALNAPTAGGRAGVVPGQRVQLDINGQPIGQATVDASGRWSIPVPPEQQQQTPAAGGQASDRTIWQRRGNVTGPIPTIQEAAGRIPGVGEMMSGGGQAATDRQYVEASSRELIRSLSQSGRYLASEMQAIEKEVDLSGRVFDNPEAYARRLIGIDEALERRVADETRILTNPNTPLEQRKAAESVLNVIQNFRQSLGVPPKVKSVDEAMKLPPGSEFIDPAGVIRVR